MDERPILIIKLSSLGDVLHPLPALHLLKEHYQVPIHWVTQPEYSSLVECFDDVDKVIVFPRRNVLRGLRSFIKTLRSTDYQAVFDFQGLLKSALIAKFAKTDKRVGFADAREGADIFYSDLVKVSGDRVHSVDRGLSICSSLGLECSEVRFPVSFPEYNFDIAGPLVALAPCSRWASKNWPIARFAELANALVKQKNASIVLLGSPDDREECAELEKRIDGKVLNITGKCSIPELGGAIEKVDLFIGNDSGPMHMAAAVKTPVIALFGPTDPVRTGPYGYLADVIGPEFTEGEEPDHRSFKNEDTTVIEKIAVSVVLQKALDKLS